MIIWIKLYNPSSCDSYLKIVCQYKGLDAKEYKPAWKT